MIKGEKVTLIQKVQSGKDGFNHAVFTDTEIDVENVLVSPASSQDILDTVNLTGKKAVLTLCIPKSDTHEWENTKVRIRGKYYRTIGQPQHYTEANVPLRWNDTIQVENYE